VTGSNGRDLSVAELEQRRTAAVKHGGKSEQRVKAIATIQKRRLLRQIGLRLRDLDAIALGYLDLWARAQSKVEIYDRWAAEHGYLDEAGASPPWVREYFAAINSARLALAKLADHLKAREGSTRLQAWLEGELADEEGR
jgi:hypothetical protein